MGEERATRGKWVGEGGALGPCGLGVLWLSDTCASGPATAERCRGGGGGAEWRPGSSAGPAPPIHIRKFFLRKQVKFIKGARN